MSGVCGGGFRQVGEQRWRFLLFLFCNEKARACHCKPKASRQYVTGAFVGLFTWRLKSCWCGAVSQPLNHLSRPRPLNLFYFLRLKQTERKKGRMREGKWEEQEREDKVAIHEDCRMFDMKSPENSGNCFGLFWVKELWAYQWLWDETREALRCSNGWSGSRPLAAKVKMKKQM